ncbi:hypothetical protein B0A48_11253 [Cryoendolithus antarcticus]|uniref:Zn(2)-C6 fungal-type domain-containing protein n=1 Tax=Cryoendolithus antarcticus TaxID=1507870 RepID=A0A1V8SV93_9PEZI|nr:hypothetical protein B0A48_11253 [Cryoendolithus antarcticus]
MASVTATAISSSNGEYSLGSSARPVISIDRLPIRRVSNEPREAMNCKSCRKRKIKCTRVRPVCEACTTFNSACIYDAIPQKRGPKTGLTEGTTRRNNGTAKRLKTEADGGLTSDETMVNAGEKVAKRKDSPILETEVEDVHPTPGTSTAQQMRPEDGLPGAPQYIGDAAPASLPPPLASHAPARSQSLDEILLDVYLTRLHGKPFYIIDEATFRVQQSNNGVTPCLSMAIRAVSIKYAPQLCGGYAEATRLSQEWLIQSRAEIDVDEPSVEHAQALLLLALAAHQHGNGKKACMLLAHAISMVMVLGLHREPVATDMSAEQACGRGLFWSCYLMDRFAATGSTRPSLIPDEYVTMQVDSWQHTSQGVQSANGVFAGSSSLTMLARITKILGETNRYLAAGGVRGDSHFPWHVQSTISKLRVELDMWATSTQDAFKSLDSAYGLPDSPALVLSKMVYHLIHCLIYRPFLPMDLTELTGPGQTQSWQIEATNLCFVHANAIAELVEIGKHAVILDWSSFVGYCISTAGTIHVHGAHYLSATDGSLAARSADYLSREMVQLTDLRLVWAGVQQQLDTLKQVYNSHTQLVKSLAHNPIRYAPVFQMEDFFARYPEVKIDGAHVSLVDVAVLPSFQQQSLHDTRQRAGDAVLGWPGSRSDLVQSQLPMRLNWTAHQTPVKDAQKSKKRRVEQPVAVIQPVATPSGRPANVALAAPTRQLQTPDQASYHWPPATMPQYHDSPYLQQNVMNGGQELHFTHFDGVALAQPSLPRQVPDHVSHDTWPQAYPGNHQTPGDYNG